MTLKQFNLKIKYTLNKKIPKVYLRYNSNTMSIILREWEENSKVDLYLYTNHFYVQHLNRDINLC